MTKFYVFNILFSGREDEQNGKMFVECEDTIFKKLFKNGNIDITKFRNMNAGLDLNNLATDPRTLVTKLIDKPWGPHSFSFALEVLQMGFSITRSGWNGKGMWVSLQVPDEHSNMTLPYMYLNYPISQENPKGMRVPWVPSQTDLLAKDWFVIE